MGSAVSSSISSAAIIDIFPRSFKVVCLLVFRLVASYTGPLDQLRYALLLDVAPGFVDTPPYAPTSPFHGDRHMGRPAS